VAQKIQTLFIDDLDGSTAEGTVRFELDRTECDPEAPGLRRAALQSQA